MTQHPFLAAICSGAGRVLLVGGLLAVPAVAPAQQLHELSLEELMRIDAGRVFGASERTQPVTEAPASVTFVTREEIARMGYRTLAEVLRGVRGMFVTDDRNYSYLGARGFATPGDYNSRILLLVNGHRVNDNVFGQAEIGAEFGMDPAMFERVEIIRGPASSLYGDSAFFAVVNVITRSGASLDAAEIAVEGGSLGTARARTSVGRRFANGVDFALSATAERSAGVEQLYFPAFDAPDTNNGVADGLDGEELEQFYGQLSFRDVTLTSVYGRRQRQIPTASLGTVFNEQTVPEQTTDAHTLLDAQYARSFGATRLSARASYDRLAAGGRYPFASAENPAVPIVGTTDILGSRWSAGTGLTRSMPGRQVLTVGAEFINNLHQDQRFQYSNEAEPLFVDRQSSRQYAVYAQDEIRPANWLILNAGVRYDGYEQFRRLSPRTAVIVMPSPNESFKYLFGSAFRAPNAYEQNPFYFGVSNLLPESINTHEVVWERYTNDTLRTAVSTYWYTAERLITLRTDPSTPLGVAYVNEGQVRARGLELEAQMRIRGGVRAVTSYALQRVTDQQTGTALTNSPRHMLKARVIMDGPTNRPIIAAEVVHLSSRTTLAGQTLGSATVANVTVTQPIGRDFELVGMFRNLFNEQFEDPVSGAHRQDSILQNGRTFRIGLGWKFWSQ
ncbi:MAG: TonB-dependent receptor [Acidobacteriota bacterium]|nr:TonB-dependent receptor [Acidobacteriota bacterium]